MEARPTLDRVKESVFNMLTGYLSGAQALDLFAGSGALGIEALSRGAQACTFVDKRREALAVVRQNLEAAHLAEHAVLQQGTFDTYLAQAGGSFDLILMDPPYGGGFFETALPLIRQRKLLSPDGLVVCEMDGTDAFDAGDFTVYRDKRYGRVRIVLLR